MADYRTLENKIRDLYKDRRKIADDAEEDADHVSRGAYVSREEPTMCGPNPAQVTTPNDQEAIQKARKSRGQHYHRVSEANAIRSILNKNK